MRRARIAALIMSSIPLNLQAVRQRIESATRAAGRPAQSVRLLAVSKTFPAEAVREAAQAGLRDFGENYVQEGVEKIRELSSLGLTWHYIGPIQSNKTRAIAEHTFIMPIMQRQHDFDLAGGRHWSNSFDCFAHHCFQRHGQFLHPHLTAQNCRHIEKVVD